MKNCLRRLPVIVAAMVAIAIFDANLGSQLSAWVAYVVPVAIAARHCGFLIGVACAFVSGGLILLTGNFAGHPYASFSYFMFGTASQTLAFLEVAWLASRLSNLEATLSKVWGSPSAASR
ncbi:MAG TPA: hypothetical protein VFA72_07485 [Burkholderiales bacterium]|nr:hypothetical protein [Burkholderiales bacterium]